MFRLPISRAHLRDLCLPLAAFPVPRVAFSASRSRFASPGSLLPSRTLPLARTTSRSLPRIPSFLPRRPFSSSSCRHPRYRPATYRRFDQGYGNGPGIPSREIAVLVVGGIGVFYIYNLETVESTGRRRFNCVPHAQELRIGRESYQQVLREARGQILPEHHPLSQSVNRVLQRLIPEAPIEGADWKVHVIHDDSMVNAFVLPGGKVFVFTGILPICKDEDGLAAVLAHEISHVVAHHSGERISSNLLTAGFVLLASILFDVSGHITRQLLHYGFYLPNSRTQEAEADDMGLMMMAKACFDPQASVRMWERMEQAEKMKVPQFMSTHPTNYNRITAIRDRLDKAESLFEEKGCHFVKQQMPQFRQVSRPPSVFGGASGTSSWMDEYF